MPLRTLVGLAALVAGVGCASTQSVRISCVPSQVQVYVDGRLLEGREADLRTDRPHKIYAKAPGYQSRLLVVEAGFDEDDLCVELVPIGMDRALEVEVERGGESEPAAR